MFASVTNLVKINRFLNDNNMQMRSHPIIDYAVLLLRNVTSLTKWRLHYLAMPLAVYFLHPFIRKRSVCSYFIRLVIGNIVLMKFTTIY